MKVINKKPNLTTVAQLIAALSEFPADLPCCAGMDQQVTIYQLKPSKGEDGDDRGYLQIDGDDPFTD